MLLGRTTELGYLNNYYDRDGSQILIVYGQKHIGKTALVKEFMKDRPGYYYLASACSEREQAYLWGRQLTHDGYVVDKFPTFQEIFEKLAHRVTGKKVLVIHQQTAAHEIRKEIRRFGDADVAAASWFLQAESLKEPGDFHLETESQLIEKVEQGGYDVIIGDRLLGRALKGYQGEFIHIAHFAVSGECIDGSGK